MGMGTGGQWGTGDPGDARRGVRLGMGCPGVLVTSLSPGSLRRDLGELPGGTRKVPVTCPHSHVPVPTAIYLLYARLEEQFGLARRAMAVYERGTRAVPPAQQSDMFHIYIRRAAELFGVTHTRPIYQRAIEVGLGTHLGAMGTPGDTRGTWGHLGIHLGGMATLRGHTHRAHLPESH